MRTRLMPVLIAAVLSLALAGCLVQTTIDAKGGGTLKAEMRGAKNTTLDAAKRGFQGPGVTITKATMDADKHAVIEIAYKDFRTLGQLGQFNNVKFTMTDDDKAKTRTATAVVKATKPMTVSDEQLAYFGKDVTISVTAPGEVTSTNGTQKGKTVTWTTPLNTILGGTETTYTVTYKNSGKPLGDAPTPAPTPAAATPAAAAAATPQPKKK